jgi:hypothetical protein
VKKAIEKAEAILPGRPAPDGEMDPRWQAIIAVGEFIETDPEAVWVFIQRWGKSRNEDLRMAIATCLLEHLLEHHFEAFFPRVSNLAKSSPAFAATVSRCGKFGQTKKRRFAAQLDKLVIETKPVRRRWKS